ncbi:MAG TPA: hypothetical protein VFV99_29320 [Kofleriaceae bacterium]|nr:hypothetical protein [Kofleriaceae bacterium]
MKRFVAITFVMLWTAVASAQQKPDVSALETSGNKHFELAEYDAAISDFKEAFRISDEPGYLYNIAQAYRLKRDCREAATFYKTYLRRVPKAPNAAKVRERITEMEKCAETQPATPPPVTTTPTTTTPTTTTPTTTTAQPEPLEKPEDEERPETPPAANPRGWMKWAGIAAIGVGALGGGLAIKFALDGKSANDDLAKLCETSCTGADAKALESDGNAANRNAVIASVAGGAFLATGVVFLVLSRSGATQQPEVSLQLTRGGAAAGYAWRF